MTLILPPASTEKLLQQFDDGKKGILYVKDAITQVDSKKAKASVPEDEAKVKQLINDSVGFTEVDKKIGNFLIEWVSVAVQDYLKALVAGGTPGDVSGAMNVGRDGEKGSGCLNF